MLEISSHIYQTKIDNDYLSQLGTIIEKLITIKLKNHNIKTPINSFTISSIFCSSSLSITKSGSFHSLLTLLAVALVSVILVVVINECNKETTSIYHHPYYRKNKRIMNYFTIWY